MLGRTRGVTSAVVVAAVCGLGAVGLSACGGGSTFAPIAKAAELSTGSSGYLMRFTLQFTSSALPAPITATGTGRFDRRAHAGSIRFNMDLSSIPQASAALGGGQLQLQEIIHGTTIYIKLPGALAGRIPGATGKPWFKIDLAKAGSASGIPGIGSLINNPTSTDPSQLLQYLRATSGSVTNLGSSQVDGISTTGYRAEVDLDKVPDAMPAADQAQAKQAIAAIEKSTHLHQVPVEVWIDGQNLVRRMQVSFNASLPTGQSLDIRINADVLEYGPQPPPVLPPAHQVTDLSALAGAAGGASRTSSGASTTY
jgi:hypothetical protein